MKRILIVGKGSYIGTSFERWLSQWPDQYSFNTIDTMNDSWKEHSFGGYDSVLNVAGIAHVKETKENVELYYKVNRDLAYQIAQKAKVDGVKHFVFLSSMSVYGNENNVINKTSPIHPINHYGKSKYQAERLITSLEDGAFNIAILRPPMVYGKGCKGNYPRLAKLALNSPLFPKIENKRSMIYIFNLCMFIQLIIDDHRCGIYFPQNEEYVCTSEMVKLIADLNGKKIWMTEIFNPILRKLKFGSFRKIFGNLVYEKNLSLYEGYKPVSIEESIKMTEM